MKNVTVADGVKAVLQFENASIKDAIALCEMVDDLGLKDALPEAIVMDGNMAEEFKKHHLI